MSYNSSFTQPEFNKLGPSEIVIPEQKYDSCVYCKYYEYRLFKSGRDPIYHSTCNHPLITKQFVGKREIDDFLNPVSTPDWCPFYQIQNQVDTIETEI